MTELSAQVRVPLFVVGEPRSGTTLVRNLLSQHPKIALTDHESHFIPSFVAKFGRDADFRHSHLLDAFIGAFRSSQLYLKGLGDGRELRTQDLVPFIQDGTLAEVIEAVFRFYSPDKPGAQVWGDKTPAYLRHLDLLHELFPSARFIHVIRDPRDHVLSERKVWGKSCIRSAQHWSDRIQGAREVSQAFPDAYLEVRYEDLLDDLAAQMRLLTAHVGVEYEDAVTQLQRPSDELGDSRELLTLNKANAGKWHRELRPSTRRRVEQIAGVTAKSLGYSLGTTSPGRTTSAATMRVLAVHDAVAMTRYYVRTKGLRDGLSYARASRRERTVPG